MGLYVGVATRDGAELREFWQDKYAGGREFLKIISDGKLLQLGDDWEMLRPEAPEIPRIESAIAASELDNRELFGRMIASLASNPDHWLKVSY